MDKPVIVHIPERVDVAENYANAAAFQRELQMRLQEFSGSKIDHELTKQMEYIALRLIDMYFPKPLYHITTEVALNKVDPTQVDIIFKYQLTPQQIDEVVDKTMYYQSMTKALESLGDIVWPLNGERLLLRAEMLSTSSSETLCARTYNCPTCEAWCKIESKHIHVKKCPERYGPGSLPAPPKPLDCGPFPEKPKEGGLRYGPSPLRRLLDIWRRITFIERWFR